YRLNRGAAVVDPDAARSMTLDDHRAGFTAAMGALIAEFNGYLDAGSTNPAADDVSYRQLTLWLTPRERARLVQEGTQQLMRYLENRPRAGRAAYRLSTIFFPTQVPGARSKPASRVGGGR